MPRTWALIARLAACLALSAAEQPPGAPADVKTQKNVSATRRKPEVNSSTALRHRGGQQQQQNQPQQKKNSLSPSANDGSRRSHTSHALPSAQDKLQRLHDENQFRKALAPEEVGQASWRAWNAAALLTWAIWLALTLLAYAFAYPERRPPDGERWSSADPQKVMTEGHFHCLHDHKVCLWSFCCPSLRWADTVSLGGYASFWAAFGTFALLSLLNYMNFYTVAIVMICTAGGFVYHYAKFVEKSAPDHFENKENNEALKWAIVGVSVLLLIMAICSLGFVLYSLLWSWETSLYMGYLGCFTWGAFTTAAMVVHRQALRQMFGMPYGNCSTMTSDWCFVFWCPWCAVAQEARAVQDAYKCSHHSVKDGPAAEVLPTAETMDMSSYYGSSS